MDLDEQQMLRILSEANGDPVRLALSTVDITYAALAESERARIRDALLAAAIPHWFDEQILSAVLDTSIEEGALLTKQLSSLPNVESFLARGVDAHDVHEASRLLFREHLRSARPDLWKTYSERAHDYFRTGTEAHLRIESLFHLFAENSESAVIHCRALDRAIRNSLDTRSALCLALNELTAAGWLTGAALVEAIGIPLWYRASRGEVSLLETEALGLLDLARRHAHPSRLADVLILVGDVCVTHAQMDRALDAFDESHSILRKLTKQNPTDIDWNRSLSVSLERLGDHAMRQGEPLVALDRYNECLTIAERLALRDPGNIDWQRDLAVSLSKLGELAFSESDFPSALQRFTASLAIRRSLADRDPSNSTSQRSLSVSLSKLGALAMKLEDYAGALERFSECLRIRERLVLSDPSNLEWQRDLSLTLERLGDIAMVRNDPVSAWAHFTASLDISRQLAENDPTNAEFQSDLAISHIKRSDVADASSHAQLKEDESRAAFTLLDDLSRRGIRLDPGPNALLERLRAKHTKR